MVTSVEREFLRPWIRRPGPQDHKYSRGVVTFHTGSSPYPGAALIGIQAALATGVGMIRYCGPEDVSRLVLSSFPEVVLAPGSTDASVLGSGMAEPLDVVDASRVAEAVSGGGILVVDAGALEKADQIPSPAILTPHHGELVRLSHRFSDGRVTTDVEMAAKIASVLGHVVVAKGSHTSVVDRHGSLWALPVASPFLATAGTGDALAGIIGALVAVWHERLHAQQDLLPEVAVAGALLHARAAEEASRANGGGPFTIAGLCAGVSRVVGQIMGEQWPRSEGVSEQG